MLLSLAFWTTLWGAPGAVLSVPPTAVVRMSLVEIDHEYCTPIVKLFKGEISEIFRPTGSPDEAKKALNREFSKDSAAFGSPVGLPALTAQGSVTAGTPGKSVAAPSTIGKAADPSSSLRATSGLPLDHYSNLCL